jgi:hypothetical protein
VGTRLLGLRSQALAHPVQCLTRGALRLLPENPGESALSPAGLACSIANNAIEKVPMQSAWPWGMFPRSDRSGLTTFPPLQTGRETFASSGFPVLTRATGLRWLVLRCGWLRLLRHSLASNFSQPLTALSVSSGVPWRTFTLSGSLQTSVWLLRRLRPLFRTLAFSRPLRVKRHQSSPVPSEEVIVSRSSLLYAGWSIETALNTSEVVEATTLPFGLGVVSAISPIAGNDAYDGFPSTQISCVCIGHRASRRSAFG